MKISTLKQFEQFLETRIPTREALFMGDIGLRRAKYFMKMLGNPQNKIKVIHVAGTSGKGSTCHITSHLLRGQGFNVGMSISPHVFDIRERFQINNALVNEKLVVKYFNQMLPVILKMEKCKYGMPTFFEINVALAYFMFSKEKLDFAVMETGLGGLLDGTNTVTLKNKLCVITKLGLDHTEILGNTFAKIASEKAGIIQKQNIVISIQQTENAMRVIKKTCAEKHSSLEIITKRDFKIISSSPTETIFDFRNLKNIHLNLIGIHQAENCSLALSVLHKIAKRYSIAVNESALRKSLQDINVPGRMEIMKIKKQTIIIDGAHNPQKMQAFTSNLSKIFPKKKFTFIVAFKKGKEYEKMLDLITPLADQILLTHFSTSGMDNHWNSVDNKTVSNYLKSKKFKNYEMMSSKQSDIQHNIRTSKNPVIITGSLYLIGNIYKRLK